MGYKSAIAKIAANVIAPGIYKEQQNAIAIQQGLLRSFITRAAYTDFGKEHHFHDIKNYNLS